MQNFKFNNPVKYVFGKNTIPEIGDEIKNHGIGKVLMLCGGGSIKKNGVYDQVVQSLTKHEIKFEEVWGVVANPTLSHAREAAAKIKEGKHEAILAVGGGSVIDEAKSIAGGVFKDDVWDIFEAKEAIKEALPIFVIQTLSATGSEMNSFAVLTNEDEKKKWAIGGPALFPKVTILDPQIQGSLPRRQTVNGGVDSLSHIMEFYFKGNDEDVTLSINEALMKSIIRNIDILIYDPHNYNARASFAWASTLALNGISGAGIGGGEWAVHRIEHGISAIHPEVAHAEGLAIVFPAWIEYVKLLKPEIFERWAKNVWQAEDADSAIDKMKAKFKKWGAPISLTDVKIKKDEIPEIAENVMMQGEFGTIDVLRYEDVVEILNICL